MTVHVINDYLNMIRIESTYGDHLTLQAISEYFFVRTQATGF